jgi:hypothetical protein
LVAKNAKAPNQARPIGLGPVGGEMENNKPKVFTTNAAKIKVTHTNSKSKKYRQRNKIQTKSKSQIQNF